MALRVITCLPNGRVLEDRVRDVPQAPAPVGRRFAPHVIADGKLSKVPIAAPVESLKFDWTANRALGFAAATLWRDRKIALTMVYLASDSSQSLKLGLMFAGSSSETFANPILLAYATTKGAIQNFTGGLAQMLAEKGIRVNAVAPGPIWTPLIPSTMPEEAVKNFGKQVPLKRAGQPAELATAYVMLADPLSSYTSGTTVAVTGGKPFI